MMAIERLSAEDRMMLEVSARWPQDIGVLATLNGASLMEADGRLRIELIRALVGARLHRVHRLRQVIRSPRRGLGAPLWVDAPAIDLRHHVQELRLGADLTERSMHEAVEHLRRRPLDPSRPLWEMWFLTGLPDERVGLFIKLHHSIGDGLAAVAILKALFDSRPDETADEPMVFGSAEPMPSALALVLDTVAHRFATIRRAVAILLHPRRTLHWLRAVWPDLRELLAGKPGPQTSLNQVIGPDRSLAVVSVPYDRVRRVGREQGATVNDVLLALIAGGLRSLLEGRGEAVDGLRMPVFVPVTLRRRLRATDTGTQIAQMVVPLPVGEADPVRRLRAVAAATRRRKARVRTPLSIVFGGRRIRRLALRAVIAQRVNVTTASIPGPAHPLFFAGAAVLEIVPVVALIGNVPLGVGAVSYAGQWEMGIVADRQVVPDLEAFVAGVRADLAALGIADSAAPAEARAA